MNATSLRWQRGAGPGIRSQVPMPVDRNHCSRMQDPYFMPRSVVAVVSQEGHGDALSVGLLLDVEAGCQEWKRMRLYLCSTRSEAYQAD